MVGFRGGPIAALHRELGGLLAAAALGAACAVVACVADDDDRVVLLPPELVARMNQAFAQSNRHWDELADLNTLEKMLGTVRATQREYLGCLQGRVDGDTVRVDGWVPAGEMKQLQLAVAGDCGGVPRLVGTWHTHPYRADLANRPIKSPRLSPQDLETFAASGLAVTLVMWDRDSLDAAARAGRVEIVHPATIVIRPPSP